MLILGASLEGYPKNIVGYPICLAYMTNGLLPIYIPNDSAMFVVLRFPSLVCSGWTRRLINEETVLNISSGDWSVAATNSFLYSSSISEGVPVIAHNSGIKYKYFLSFFSNTRKSGYFSNLILSPYLLR